jgi:hypothetical protein
MKSVSLLVAALSLVLVTGCSKAPVIEIQNSEAALQAALGAEAPEYAPKAYQMAVDSLNAAQDAKKEQDSKFGLFRSYGKATQMYVTAQAMAEKAKAQAIAEKERMKAELTAMLGETQALLDSANVVLEKAPRGKGTKADLEMIKTDLASAIPAFEQAKADFDGGKYMAAKAGMDAVQNKVRGIITELQAAFAKKM